MYQRKYGISTVNKHTDVLMQFTDSLYSHFPNYLHTLTETKYQLIVNPPTTIIQTYKLIRTHTCYRLSHKHSLKIKIKSLLLSHNHSTCALVSEILQSVLQTVQKQFIYIQYILTDCTEDNVQNTHTYTQYTQCTIRHTYSYQYIFYTVCTHSTLCTHIYTQYAKVQQILHRPDMQYHGCALDGIQW